MHPKIRYPPIFGNSRVCSAFPLQRLRPPTLNTEFVYDGSIGAKILGPSTAE